MFSHICPKTKHRAVRYSQVLKPAKGLMCSSNNDCLKVVTGNNARAEGCGVTSSYFISAEKCQGLVDTEKHVQTF